MNDDRDYVGTAEGMFINTNEKDLLFFKQLRERALKERAIQHKLDRLEKEVVQIKQLLQKHLVRTQ